MATASGLSDSTAAYAERRHLKAELGRATRKQKMQALLLVVPLLLFLLFTFVYPIGVMLVRSVYSPEFSEVMHRTSALLADWDGRGLPGEDSWAALAADLREARENQTLGVAATVVNFEMPAARSLFTKSGRIVEKLDAPYKEALIAFDSGWGDPAVWSLMKRLADPLTARFYLRAVDHEIGADGRLTATAEQQRIYISLFIRTIAIALGVTVACLILGYPVAYLMSTLPLRYANILIILVLLPFWTSLLVRTTAWIVLLQTEGTINSVLVWAGVLNDGQRFQLIFNTTGSVIAMTHILLPYMILPLYAVMRSIPSSYMRAARSLGAGPFTALRRVYIPQTLPAVGAGCLIVFILAIGYYITPALVGGETGTLISNMIAYHMQRSLNWGLAAALGSLLLAAMMLLYWIYNRFLGLQSVKFA